MSKSPDTQKHTPGPWTLEREKNIRLLVRTAPDRCYAFHPDDEPNARLIAAAPELLEALKTLVSWLGAFYDRGEQLGNLDMRHIARARAALAKAEGGHNA